MLGLPGITQVNKKPLLNNYIFNKQISLYNPGKCHIELYLWKAAWLQSNAFSSENLPLWLSVRGSWWRPDHNLFLFPGIHKGLAPQWTLLSAVLKGDGMPLWDASTGQFLIGHAVYILNQSSSNISSKSGADFSNCFQEIQKFHVICWYFKRLHFVFITIDNRETSVTVYSECVCGTHECTQWALPNQGKTRPARLSRWLRITVFHHDNIKRAKEREEEMLAEEEERQGEARQSFLNGQGRKNLDGKAGDGKESRWKAGSWELFA